MGLPLMSYTIKTELDSELFDRVIVSTNDKETSEIASQLGAEVPFLRPDIISSNLSADIQWVRLAIDDWLNLDEVTTACQMNGVTMLIVNKMDVLDQVNDGWNFYQDGILNVCSDEGTFMLKIINHITRYNPGIEIEFQGQLH